MINTVEAQKKIKVFRSDRDNAIKLKDGRVPLTHSSKRISVTILTKNSERYIGDVLKPLRAFDEVIVLDTGSTDETVEIAKEFSNVKLYYSDFAGFGYLHNKAEKLARNEWILAIDSDEIISKELADEILSLDLNDGCVYSFKFENYFNGKLIKSCGWYPDRHVRLYNKKITAFSDNFVHEHVNTAGLEEVLLKGHVSHYSYSSIDDFLSKMQLYSRLFAEHNVRKRKASPFMAVIHSVWAFFKYYILRRGFLQGYEGFVISISNANTVLYKYLKLYEANKKKQSDHMPAFPPD